MSLDRTYNIQIIDKDGNSTGLKGIKECDLPKVREKLKRDAVGSGWKDPMHFVTKQVK